MPKRSPLFVFPDFYFEKVSAIYSYHVCPETTTKPQSQNLGSAMDPQQIRLGWPHELFFPTSIPLPSHATKFPVYSLKLINHIFFIGNLHTHPIGLEPTTSLSTLLLQGVEVSFELEFIGNNHITCQKRISCIAAAAGLPSGHIGKIIYTANLSFALILLAIFNANSIGIRLSAPAQTMKVNNLRTNKEDIWYLEHDCYPNIYTENTKNRI